MIELARDLAHNKGMSLLFSSHLLPDVEAVCDHVAGARPRPAAGRRARSSDLKQVARPVFEVRVKGDAGAVRRRGSTALGCAAEPRATTCCSCELPDGADAASCCGGAAADAGRADPLPAAAAQHAGRGVPRRPSGARLMPIFDQGYQHWYGPARPATPGGGWRSPGTASGIS